MAKKVDDIETIEIEVVKPASPKIPKENYIVKESFTVGDKIYQKGDKISLSERGYKSLRSIKKV